MQVGIQVLYIHTNKIKMSVSKLMSQLPYSSTKYQKTITITVHEQHIIFYLNSMIIYTYSYDPSRT